MSAEKVLGAFLAGPAEGHNAEALADLTLAAVQQSADPQQSLSIVISALLLPKRTEAEGRQLPSEHGHPVESSSSMQEPAIQTGVSSESITTNGLDTQLHSLAVSNEDIITQFAVIKEDTVELPAEDESSALPASASPVQSSVETAGSTVSLSPHKASSEGQLTHLCTLLSRMGAQSEQDSNHLWQAEASGAVSKHLAQADVLITDPHAAKALALLLRGDGTNSFLSPKAISDAFEDLLPMLEHGTAAQSTPHTPCSPMCQSAQKRHRAQLGAQAVLHVLDLCLFSTAVMLGPEGLRHAALWLLCTVYRLACLPKSQARHGLNSPPELAYLGKALLLCSYWMCYLRLLNFCVWSSWPSYD